MPSKLTAILRERKAEIAERLIEIDPASQSAQNHDARQAMAVARIDSLLGMAQQSPDILEQTLKELLHSQTRNFESLETMLAAVESEHRVVEDAIASAYPDSADAIQTISQLNSLTRQRTRTLLSEMHQQMAEQLQATAADRQALRAAVQELSTPIIPLYSGILVLPLVGRIDDSRAQDITESLLEAIAREQADIVLLDVTGISTLDTSVANHLMQTARAAALLGSQVVLVGISAEIAQTLVYLNVDLGNLVTLSDLQSGVEYALDLQGLAVRPKE